MAAALLAAAFLSGCDSPTARIELPAAASLNPFLPEGSPNEGWPFIRGPTYDGHSREVKLADQWAEEGPPVLWSRPLGQGYSAFVAHGERVYTQVQTLGGQYVVCLHADTGETLWEHRYDWPYDAAGVYPGPRATPTLYQDRVYFATPSGVIACLRADSGDPIWSVNVVEEYKARGGTGFGYACSPTVLEGRVLLPVGGPGASMVALSAADGSLLWESGDDSASYSPAMPITFGGRRLVVGYLENALVGFDRSTGEIVWREPLSHGYDEHSAWPLYREPRLWTAAPFRSGSTMWELSAEGEKLKTVWYKGLLSNDVISSVLVGDHIYGFDIRDAQAKTQRTSRGVFRCLEWETGEPAWAVGDEAQRQVAKDAIGHASLIVADGKLLLLNDVGELILARANPEYYEELGRASVLPGAIGWTPPTLHRGRVYVRNHSQAVCIYVGKPELLDASLRAQTKTIEELPRSWSFDWTHAVLPIEPEYAFDLPSTEWLVSWFGWSVAMLGIAWSAAGIWSLTFLKTVSPVRMRTAALVLAGLGGAIGTSLLSRWRDDFVFTWPLTIYAAFHLAALWLPLSRRQLDPKTRRHSFLGALAIAASAGGYFWLCRRLSLVFEWAFLAGYLPALLMVLVDRWVCGRSWHNGLKNLALASVTFLGFAGFYWSGVALLWLRYR
jgi:outer membrane protein assembly factor BamB